MAEKKKKAAKKASPAKKTSAKKKASTKAKSGKKKTSTKKKPAARQQDALVKAGGNIAEELARHAKEAITAQFMGKLQEGGESELDKVKDLLHIHGKEKKDADGASVANAAQELRELKKLLDEKVINEQEFDAKKKQLLGI